MRKLGIAVLVILALGAVVGGIIYAAGGFTASTSGHVTVVTPTPTSTPTPGPTYTISLWQDSLCTVPLSGVNWGTVTAGTGADQVIYVRNDGNQIVSINASSDLNGTIGAVTKGNILSLAPATSGAFTLHLAVVSGAAPGDQNFTVYVSSS